VPRSNRLSDAAGRGGLGQRDALARVGRGDGVFDATLSRAKFLELRAELGVARQASFDHRVIFRRQLAGKEHHQR
jgi:hypothetical protein